MNHPPHIQRPLLKQMGRIHRFISWLLHVDSPDIVRQTLNRAFIVILCGWIVLAAVYLLFALLLSFDIIYILGVVGIVLLSLPLIWAARRGRSAPVLILAVVVAAFNALVFIPESYVDPPVVHVVFVLPVLMASLFMEPWIGLLFVPVQVVFLLLAMIQASVPSPLLLATIIYFVIDLGAIGLPIAVAAQLLRRTIGEQRHHASQLDALVAQRTAELQRLIRLREQDTTAAVHDINNRLLVVRAEIDLLLADAHDAGIDPQLLSEAELRLDRAILAVQHLADDLRTAALLDHAGLQIERTPLQVAELVEKVVSQYQAEARMSETRLLMVVDEWPPLVPADARRLERVLANVISNAIKYSRSMAVERRNVLVRVLPKEGGVAVLVIDQGPGLSAEQLALLGRPFTRLNGRRGEEGMGMGIYISRGIVELHGGRLHYASAGPGRGVRVELWLPMGDAEVAEVAHFNA